MQHSVDWISVSRSIAVWGTRWCLCKVQDLTVKWFGEWSEKCAETAFVLVRHRNTKNSKDRVNLETVLEIHSILALLVSAVLSLIWVYDSGKYIKNIFLHFMCFRFALLVLLIATIYAQNSVNSHIIRSCVQVLYKTNHRLLGWIKLLPWKEAYLNLLCLVG